MGCVQMLAPLAHTKQITLQNNIPADVFLTAERNMLETIIRNLLSNAIKFTPEHGTVLLNLVINNSFYEVSVVDSGIGLSKEDILKLFRIDVKNSEIGEGEGKGTGLGLILSKEFVTKQGGDIWVTSEPGHGSTFTFSIPREARHIPAS
jgi:signal transduction histidine kinase